MPRTKNTLPPPDKEKGQRQLELPDYITRILPIWQNPGWLSGEMWRNVVKSQPIAMICRETLIANITSLEWKIEPRDSTMRDEYRSDIEHYTRILENGGDLDYTQLVEWISQDYLDIPFGAGVEVGREGDNENGKVRWIKPIDGSTLFTLFPTLNSQWPVGQFLKERPGDYVYFPSHSINRIYMSPRTEIRRQGWGMAPPEKIYLSLELLNRGDSYYANLLLDTPPAGILDLMDMAKDTAEAWLGSWRNLLGGTDPFKIPVLYEHEKGAQFVSFTKSPTELMFDKATLKYTAIATAGYGMSVSDIGFPTLGSGGETLAGTIRQERRTRRTGYGILKKKIKYFFDRILPVYLEFKFIDLDDELSVALGRARLASATAWNLLIDKGVFLKNEVRQQMIADGLVTVSVPDSIEGGDEIPDQNPNGNRPNERPDMLGRQVAPSQGGQGDVKLSEYADGFSVDLYNLFNVSDLKLRRAIRSCIIPVSMEVKEFHSMLSENDLVDYWNEVYDGFLFSGQYSDSDEVPEVMLSTINAGLSYLKSSLPIRFEWSAQAVEELENSFIALYKQKLYRDLVSKYEKGEIDTEPSLSNISVDRSVIKDFGHITNKLLDLYAEKSVELFYKSVLSGIRRYLTDDTIAITLAETLDIETFIGDNMLDYVRTSLVQTYKMIAESFIEKYLHEVNIYLEDK